MKEEAVELEAMDEFEQELRQALERRPAPPGLKRKVMERRNRQQTERLRSARRCGSGWRRAWCWQGCWGAGLPGATGKKRRKGEAAREQVMTALRITGMRWTR